MLKRKNGAMAEIVAHTGWQKHTTRGWVSGFLGKKLGIEVESLKSDQGERTYRINSQGRQSRKGPMAYMRNTDIVDALNQLAAVPVPELRQLLNCAGPLRARALLVAANLRKAVLQENPSS
jgi:Protein of unknown function (DUF3489)